MSASNNTYRRETEIYRGLDEGQWLSATAAAEAQAAQIEKLVRHARAHVPFYAERLAPLFTRRGHFNLGAWHDVEPLKRSEVRDRFQELRSATLPPEAGRAFQILTSGSTAEPLKALKCSLQTVASTVTAVRFMNWHGFDYRLPWAAIRAQDVGAALYPEGRTRKGRWGPYWLQIEGQGPWRQLTMVTPPERQLEWLSRVGRCYLNTMPINLKSLIHAVNRDPGLKPAIAAVVTLGETVKQDLRENCREVLGCEIFDQYSSIECGLIASQCPVSGHLHAHREAMLVEALREDGSQCAVGEEGRACITPLLSFAMPLIRYRMGDLITVLPPCACGRSLPLISVSGGRLKSRFRFPDGIHISPDFPVACYSNLLGALRWQSAQTGPETIEIRFVSEWPDSDLRPEQMTAVVRQVLNRPVTVNYKRIAAFPVTPGGKHFDYVCELPEAAA